MQKTSLYRFIVLGLSTVLLCWGLGLGSPPQGQAALPGDAQPLLGALGAVVPADLVEQGKQQYAAGQYLRAIALWQQAAQIFASQGDRLNQAMVLSNLSLAQQQLGQWPQARQAITDSLGLLNQMGGPVVGGEEADRQRVLAQAWNTQGSLELSTGNPEAALTAWSQATQAYTQAKDPAGILRSQMNQTQALTALGLYRRALDILAEINRTLQTSPDNLTKAVALRNLGNALRLVGDLPQAELILRQSLALAQTYGSAPDISATLAALGATAQGRGNTKAALQYYQQAAAQTTVPLEQVQANLNRLGLLAERPQGGQISELLGLITQIQAPLAALPPSHAAIYARINLAKSLIKLAPQPGLPAPTTIAQILAVAIQQARDLGDRRGESYALGTLGYLYEQNRQNAEAETTTRQALLIAQAINAPDIAYLWQWQLGRLLRAEQKNPAAIVAYDQAVKTLKSLRNDLISVNQDVQFSFRETVEPVYRQFVELLLDPPNNSQGSNQETSQANLVQARALIESLQLAELDNFFKEACLEGHPVQVDQVDPKAAILYPIILEQRLEVVLSIPGQPLRHYSSPVGARQVKATVKGLRQSLSPVASLNQRLRLAQQIYGWLIQPAEAALSAGQMETLVFILDGDLRNLPMGVLYDGKQFLVERYNISLTPGLQLINPRPLAQQPLKLLTAGLTEARQGFSALPGVRQELQAIQAEVPGTQLLLNQQLSQGNLETRLGAADFNVVHLATHGQFSSKAEDTFILTWDDRINVRQLDSLLQGRDRQAAALELLVLSACQTAVGDDRATLGLAGVAIRSGARSTIASLWSVNDEAASTLMAQFYHELIQPGTTKTQALRRAQLTLLNQPQYQAPYYWAPFVLVGNWL